MKTLTICCLLVSSAGAIWAQSADKELIGETNALAILVGNRLHGTWVGTALGPTPQMINFERSGTYVSQTAFQAGGYSVNDLTFSPIYGTWRRTGARSFETLGFRFVYTNEGTLQSAERVVGTYTFGASFQELNGEATLEEILCEDVPGPPAFPLLPACPDILKTPADVVRGPFPIRLERANFER